MLMLNAKSVITTRRRSSWKIIFAISKRWTYLKSIKDECSNLTLVYEQEKNAENLFGKVHTSCLILISKKNEKTGV